MTPSSLQTAATSTSGECSRLMCTSNDRSIADPCFAELIESSRRRFSDRAEADVAQHLTALNERLSRIETALRDIGAGDSSHGIG